MGSLLPLTLTVFLSTLSLSGACNITAVLEKSGCNTFASLVSNTGVINSYVKAQKGPGLTLFAPSDDAFKGQGAPDLSKLTNTELLSLLQYHALARYVPKDTLKTMTKDPISTLATNPIGKYDLTVRVDGGGNVTVETGVDSGKIVRTAIDEAPVCVFVLDRVLLPEEIFGNATSPTPPGPSPGPDVPAPAAPAPKKSGAEDVERAGIQRAVVAMAASVIVTVFLS